MDTIYKVQTSKSFIKAIEDLKVSLNSYNFGVLWELDFKDKLKEKELDFDKNIKILEVCNPTQAKQALEEDLEVGFFLPCKMVVYEDKNSVFIGMLKPTEFIGTIKNDALLNIAKEVEKELKSAIQNAS